LEFGDAKAAEGILKRARESLIVWQREAVRMSRQRRQPMGMVTSEMQRRFT
jgi:hypothetical protein